MKLITLLFTTLLCHLQINNVSTLPFKSIAYTDGNSYNYNLTSYYYNSSNCNTKVVTYSSVLLNSCENITNKCIYDTSRNFSYFQICFENQNKKIVKKKSKYDTICSLRILLTILGMGLVFIVYKWCLETYIDNMCLDLRYKCENGCQQNNQEEYRYL